MKRPPKPPLRLRWTSANRFEHVLVRALHGWLERQQLTIGDLTQDLLEQFLERPRGSRVFGTSRRRYRNRLRRYLQWLHDHAVIGFAPKPPRRASPALPSLARAFLASLLPTHRAQTRKLYTYSLRQLHGWLDPRGLVPERLTRSKLAPWFQGLHAAGLHPSTRRRILIDVRVYLHWVSEHRRMRTPPDELIRRTDLPKLPRYLPRPLTAEADRALQHRLARSRAPEAWALLLMRRSGIRIGELRDLEYHCLRRDRRYSLLKVPLGKLNDERLVPIDTETVELIHRLQSIEPRSRSWLVPGVGSLRVNCERLRCVLDDHSQGLPDPVRITSHRLRHTYATEMLSAGMSLVGVMRLLGHRDYRMTLRYTAIVPETVGDEYAKALERLATKYHLPARPPASEPAPDPDQLLDHLARWLRKHASSRQPLRPLLKRIERLRHDVRSVWPSRKRRP